MNFLNQAYNRDNYLDFLADKFNFAKHLVPIVIDNNDVESLQQLGTVTSQDGKKLPVFEIHIKPNTQLSRNRVQLRNLVAKQIGSEDGALAVYVDDENKQWRFSFIAIEYRFTDTGVTTEKTASKRFTYLLGKNTQTRTAQDRFGVLNKQSTLQDLKTAFAVEALSKDFYDKLYKWYDRAQSQVRFPNDEQAENHSQTSLIRLLTRLLFIWFIKEKGLIKADLFDKDKLQTLIDYDEPSSFYKAILQNLFFATLNRPVTERSFRNTTNGAANSTNYLVTNIYRYQDYFIDSDEDKIIALFARTPFLNGGLFECLDREASEKEKQAYDKDQTIRPVRSAMRMDGFSDRADNELVFHNHLFFKDTIFNDNKQDDKQDLGLIDLFNQYQFTVEESTPLDVEVALDPELLGKVFENLLASYNPETGQQARKATGSFYTPREIVNYMVDESLKQHFHQHTDLTDDQINALFVDAEFTEQENALNKQQTKALIYAIDGLKILDPAVGSGAYPMGILQRLVLILEKVDAENTHFKQQQIDKAEQIPDEASCASAIAAIEQVFSQQNQHNAYGKKLMLIENCIYGVDIQPIAIQICRLRFFISLTIEQSPNKNKADNYGIKALPNLETKFIVANSLLPLGEMPKQRGIFDTGIEELQTKLAQVRHKHFSAKTLTTKRKYRDKDKDLREQMLEELTKSGITSAVEASMKRIVHWDLYNQNAIADWFDPKWMFGVDSFDIVIGNPPYINVEQLSKNIRQHIMSFFSACERRTDIYIAFFEHSLTLCAVKGTVNFIVPHSFTTQKYGEKMRRLMLNNYAVHEIVDASTYHVFKNALVYNVVIRVGKKSNKEILIRHHHSNEKFKNRPMGNSFLVKPSDFMQLKNCRFETKEKVFKSIPLREKILQSSCMLSDICLIAYGARLNHKIKNIRKSYYISNKPMPNRKKFIEGRDIKRYHFNINGWLNYCPDEHYNPMFARLFESEKLMFINIVSDRLRFSYDSDGHYNSHTVINCVRLDLLQNESHISAVRAVKKGNINFAKEFDYKFLLGILNSRLINWYFMLFMSEKLHCYPDDAKSLPIPIITAERQTEIIKLVDRILTAKQQAQDTRTLETQIDQMVYKLYDLTDDEIDIIEKTK